jgi:peptide alpha-N-acetyltransferase
LVEPEADKIVLETECINTAALRFYEKVGFIRTRRMLNYYMSGNDAFRLKLFIR